jgi:type IV pilus biogenesis protein CpaD/CtpE
MRKRHSIFVSPLSAALVLVLAIPLSGCALDEITKESEIEPYGGSKSHPIMVEGNRAYVEDCGLWEGDVAETSQNLLHSNHGCAVQANIAAMAAYPQDLVKPRRMSMSPAEARVAAVKKVMGGEAAGTAGASPAAAAGGPPPAP